MQNIDLTKEYIHQKGNVPRKGKIYRSDDINAPSNPGGLWGHQEEYYFYGENNYFEWYSVAKKYLK